MIGRESEGNVVFAKEGFPNFTDRWKVEVFRVVKKAASFGRLGDQLKIGGKDSVKLEELND